LESSNLLILAIDDNRDNLIVLEALIMDSFPDSVVIATQNPEKVIDIAISKDPDVILMDIVMPKINGYELCKILKDNKKTNHIPIIFLTALKTDRDVRIKALEAGAEGFLSKPIDEIELIADIKAMVKIKKANVRSINEKDYLKSLVEDRTREIEKELIMRKNAEKDLKKSYALIKNNLDSAIETIASICEIKDPYTAGHQLSVAKIAKEIAREMHLSKEEIENIQTGGILHDIGKIYVPTTILVKPGKLTDTEFALIKQHSQIGYDIINKMKISPVISEMVLQHHERLNGSGYPNGLSGNQIINEARILAVADVVEAMASHRPYRPAIGIEAALEEISKNKKSLYDPDVADICLMLFKEGKLKIPLN